MSMTAVPAGARATDAPTRFRGQPSRRGWRPGPGHCRGAALLCQVGHSGEDWLQKRGWTVRRWEFKVQPCRRFGNRLLDHGQGNPRPIWG
jgi:hypothetical protein